MDRVSSVSAEEVVGEEADSDDGRGSPGRGGPRPAPLAADQTRATLPQGGKNHQFPEG
jgi:hypothetical protein